MPPAVHVRRCARALAGALALLLGAATPAHGAFSGRDGKLTYTAANGRDRAVTLRNPDGSAPRRLRTGVPASTPVFSPAGRRIAFSGQGRIWVMYADGSALRAVTDGLQPASEPAWSPDGTALAFAQGAPGARHIAVVRADGSGVTTITAGSGDDRSPAWSARGIAFVRRTRHGGDELYVTGPLGGRARRLTRTPADEESPAWSPDGRRIAFSSGRPGSRTVGVIPSAGGRARTLTAPADDAAAPAWAPDGRRMALTLRAHGRRRVAIMPARGGDRRAISPRSVDAGPPDWQPAGAEPVIAAAGDIACDPTSPDFNGGLGTPSLCHQRQTSDILMTMDLSAVLVLGDAQYSDGRAGAWSAFDSTWGRLKPLLRPVPGNHEYRDPGASGYYDYFDGAGAANGPAGARGQGYYSFDVGTWHVVALNSECSDPPARNGGVDCSAGSPQERWLRVDLAAHPATCTLAFWHHPLWSSGISGENGAMYPIWEDLYNAGADVVLNGHDHAYERLAPQDPGGTRDPVRGIREFVVGTGGRSLQRAVAPAPNSEVRHGSYGVLQLKLGKGGYRWAFVSEAGVGFTDSGANACH
ncbi:metallophosphoesterase [Candidatus Solirubrobacter pratensis]|uniref:metallophosphoesterase n=1 Tax=Candidatus Solirubrobacter pratensis TaxID=1298857 RepID=UPI0003F725FE|nr:metallophosphoesterase [Candidatus Solirubrobacter pratensis]